ncbi:MAG TPA: hypothetical protein VJ777_06760 [Mycobacterium sp.]|nr:hypothetical protein [Mycobacterium sp.]
MAAMLLSGCTRVIVGAAHPAVPGGEERPPIPVADLLIEPERFPARYPAVLLDGTAVDRVLQDIDGVPGGSVVTPPACTPPPLAPHHTAAAQGTDSEDASTLIVAVTTRAPRLRARVEQLTACPSFEAVRNGDTFSVTATMLPAPPVDADDTYAVDQTVASPSGSTRRTLTLVAQVGQVLVRATWLHDGGTDTTPDTQSLDALFTDAVLKVHRVGGP